VLLLDSLVDRCEIFWCYSISLVDDYVAHDWPDPTRTFLGLLYYDFGFDKVY